MTEKEEKPIGFIDIIKNGQLIERRDYYSDTQCELFESEYRKAGFETNRVPFGNPSN